MLLTVLRRLLLIALLAAASSCATFVDDDADEADDAEDAFEDLGEVAEPFDQVPIVLVGDGQEVELTAFVADTDALRRQGLMGWETLPDDTGMLFVFDQDSIGGFWMKDTLLPLSIAFADADGYIHTVLDMEPCQADPCPTYEPDAPYRYALEVEQGMFEEIGLELGWRIDVNSGFIAGEFQAVTF